MVGTTDWLIRARNSVERLWPRAGAPGRTEGDVLAATAVEAGWRTAATALLSTNPRLFQYIGDERAADWRFLLPTLPRGRVLCLGGALSPIPLALATTCEHVVVVDSETSISFLEARAHAEPPLVTIEGLTLGQGSHPALPSPGSYALVAALRQAPDLSQPRWQGLPLHAIAAQVAVGGHLYLEMDRPAIRLPPGLMRRQLLRLGFSPAQCFWPKPTFEQCEALIPLGDRRLQRYYLGHIFFAMSWRRRVLRSALGVLRRLSLFELVLPGYSVVARRVRERY